jgi:hypothetical protein
MKHMHSLKVSIAAMIIGSLAGLGVALADDTFVNPVWFQNRVKINGNAIDDAGVWTSSGARTLTGAQTFSGTEIHSGAVSQTGSNTFTIVYDRVQTQSITGSAPVVTISNNVVNLFSSNPAANGTNLVSFAAPTIQGRRVAIMVTGTNPVGIAASGSWKSSAEVGIPIDSAIQIISISTNWYRLN